MSVASLSFIDLQSSANTWHCAWVLEVSGSCIEVLTEKEGLQSIPTNSGRLAQFRRYSEGSLPCQLISLWHITKESVAPFSAAIRAAVAHSDFPAPHITQFYRGEFLYRLAGALQLCEYCPLPDAKLIYKEVVDPALQLIQQWLLTLRSTYAGFYKAQNAPDLVETDQDAAYAMIFREMSLCLRCVFGCEASTQPGIVQLSGYFESDRREKPGVLNIVRHSLNRFLKSYGFETLLLAVSDLE